MLRRKIFKQGNSLVVAIPDYVLAQIGVTDGDYLIIEAMGSKGLFMSPQTAQEAKALREGIS